ncbi:MAG: ABC transporter permease [Sutterella wadsworthensis]
MKHWFEGLFNAARIECRYTRRHPQQWVICALLPVMWLLFVANTFGTGLMTSSQWASSTRMAAAARARARCSTLPSLGLRGFESAVEADAALSRAETYGTIVIPRDFTKDSLNGRGSTLELIINKSYYAVGTILEVDVKTALAAVMKSAGTIRMTAARGGSLKAESNNLRIASPEVYFLGNTGFNFSAYLLPTLIPGLIALAAGLTFSGVLVREWRDGGATRLLAAANDFASAAIIGKLLPWFVFYVVLGLCWVFGLTGVLGWTAAGSVGIWIGATVMLIAAMASIAVLFTAASLSWPIAVSALICFAAPSFPFTGFSYPLESMTPGAAFFGQLLPLTHYLAVQGECWILNSPLDHIFTRLAPLGLLIVVPMAAGLPILGVRLRAWSSKDPEEDRIRTLLVKESLITDETQGGAR